MHSFLGTNKESRLSFCINTFNRPDFIKETIESALMQYTSRIEIIIYDVSTNDLTEKIVNSISSIECPINYTHADKNLGIDQDYDKAIQVANGEYCWLFSDDDLLKPGAINRVLLELESNPDLIVVNAEIRNYDFTKCLRDSILPKNTKSSYNKYQNEQCFMMTANCLSFIGSVVIKKSIWTARNKNSYFYSMFAHVGVIFQSPPLELITVINDPLIEIRHGNASWNSRAFEIWAFNWPKLIWSFSMYSKDSKQFVCKEEPFKNFKIMIFYRSNGTYSKEEYKKYFSTNKLSIYKIYLFVLSIFPGKLINSISAIYIIFCSKKNLTAIYDLHNSRYNNIITSIIFNKLIKN